MPEKYLRQDGIPILLRHTGASTLPDVPPLAGSGARSGAGAATRTSIVCLHDAGLQSSLFVDLLAALAALAAERSDACALAFDLPGHGRSGSLDALHSIEAMSACAQAVVGWCRAERPILVGHGMGALVALEWARSGAATGAGAVVPGALVLCSPGAALGIRDETIAAMREVTLGRAPRPFDPKRIAPGSAQDLMRRAYFESIQTDPRATLVDLEASQRFARALLAEPAVAPAPMPRTGIPILLVAGEQESESDRAAARALATKLSARYVEIPQAAHHLPLEQPKALAREILAVAEAA